MRQLLRYNFVALPLLMTAMAGLLVCLLLPGHEQPSWPLTIAPAFTFLIIACSTWLLIKLAVWLLKPVAARWLALLGLVTCSIYAQMPLLMMGGAFFLSLASAYWWYQGQFVPAGRQMTKREQMYWVLLNEHMDGSTSFPSRGRW